MIKKEIIKQVKFLAILLLIGIFVITILSVIGYSQDVKTKGVVKVQPIIDKQLSWDNLTLQDSTIFDATNNICSATKLGVNINITPCIANDVDSQDIKQRIQLSNNWIKGHLVDVMIVYTAPLEKFETNLLRNVSYTYSENVNENDWINNYLVYGITSFTNLTSKPTKCDLGSLNNTQYYLVTRTNGTEANYEQTICFTSRTVVNSTAFRISGNRDILVSHQRIGYREEYVDVTNKVNDVTNSIPTQLRKDWTFYKVNDLNFSYLDMEWVYTPVNKTKSGKWHILLYDATADNLIDAVQNNRYLYVDPWWNNTWNYCKNVNITNNWAASDVPFYVNVTYVAGMSFANMTDIRFVNTTCGNDGTEIPYEFDYIYSSSSAGVWVRDSTKNLANGVNQYSMYYGNPTATNGENPSLVWKDYALVYHFSESGIVIKDSSPAKNNGTASHVGYSQLNATFGRGWVTYAINQSVNITSNANLANGITGSNALTEFVWFHPTTLSGFNGGRGAMTFVGADGTVNGQFYASYSTGWHLLGYGGGNDASVGSAGAIGYQFHTVFRNTTTAQWYVNKIPVISPFVHAYSTSAGRFLIAQRGEGTNNWYQATWDEVRVSNLTFSSDYINRTYDNSDMSMFAFGAEQSGLSTPTITFTSQSPSDITSTNLVNVSAIINYTITTSAGIVDATQTNLFWLTNSSSNVNFTWYINGSILVKGFTSVGVAKSNISSTWSFVLGDNIYPATYLLNLSQYENSPHTTSAGTNLTIDNALIKAVVLNMTNLTKYNFLEYTITNMTPTVASLRVYYCNSTYTTGNIGTNPNCALVSDIPASQGFNHVENQSLHWLSTLTINTTDGTLGGIKITNPAYFAWRGRTGGWSASYIAPIARVDAIQTSGNTGSTWTNLAGTLDYHLHQFGDDTNFNYYACSNATLTGIYNCSTMRTYFLNLSKQPPSPPVILSPLNTTYSTSILTNYTASLSPVGNAILGYNITLMNADDSYNQTIKLNNSLNLSYLWTNTNITTGSFNIHVGVIDSDGLTALAESEIFYINATFQSVTTLSVSPVSPIDYGATSTFSCSNDFGLPTTLYINGVNKTSENGVAVVRAAGTYTVNCTALTTTSGNILGHSVQQSYTINKIANGVSVSSSPSNITGGVNYLSYGTNVTITVNDCPSQLTCPLTLVGGGSFTSPYSSVLNAGSYTFVSIVAGNENYTGSVPEANIVISKINPSLAISFVPASTVTNGTQTNVTGSGCPSSCILKRDGVVVSNPDSQTLDIGNYVYNYSFAGSTNYNSYSIISTLTIIPISFGGTNGSINFTATNLSQSLNFQVPYNFTTRAYMNFTGIVSDPQTCYQETANASTAGDGTCGLTYTGVYSINATLSTSTFDGSWLSYGFLPNTSYINYSKPSGNISSASWKFRDCEYLGGCAQVYNFDIPISNSCLDNTNLELRMNKVSLGTLANLTTYCKNKTDWVYLNNHQAAITDFGVDIVLVEEAINWTLTTYPSNVNVSIANNQIFYFANNFTQINNRTTNFNNILNGYLSSCSYTGGYCLVPFGFVSATAGILNYSDTLMDNYGFIENNKSFSINTTETKTNYYSLNISYDSSAYTLTSWLVYNGVDYNATSTTVGYNATLSKSLTIPVGDGTKSHYWRIGLTNSSGTTYFNSTFANQSISLLNMSFCNNPYTIPFLNYTFHNETTANEVVSATIVSSFTYWLSNASVNKTFSYTSATPQNNYTFCFTPPSETIYVAASGTYDNGYSQDRSFNNASMILTNASITKDLLLLPDTSGIYITFIVQNNYGSRISDALIDVKKTSGLIPVEQKYTDGTGSAAFWLSTATSYTITVTKSGFDTYSTGITPTTSPVTITMTATSASGGAGGVIFPVVYPIISVAPSQSILENNTNYNFNYNISYSGDLEGYGYSLSNQSTVLASDIGSETHGENFTFNYNTGNNSYLILRYYFIIDGVYTNRTKIWAVENSDGTGFSIKNGLNTINRLTSNTTSGIFGIKRGTTGGNFTFAILIFVVTMFAAGSMTYKYGITSTTAVMFVIFSIIMFFDVGAGWIPQPMEETVPHFITLILGIITAGMFVREML